MEVATARRAAAGLRSALRTVVLLAAGGVLLWWAVPHATGAPWAAVLGAVTSVPLHSVVLMAAVWAAGLYANTFVLTGAMPGLTHRRALTLSLTGSAVSNTVPFGGALGVALNLRMVRAWRFSNPAYAAYAVSTNLWDVLGKLALPLAAFGALAATGRSSGSLRAVSLVAMGVLSALLLLVVVVLRSDRVAAVVCRGVSTGLRRLTPRRWRHRTEDVGEALLETRRRVRTVVARSGARMSAGTVAYLVLQAALLAISLHAVGAVTPVPVVLAAFAVERILSLAAVTPGGTGLAEAGTAGVLVGLGGDPVAVAAGVLLYRAFVFLLEIPVGGMWLGAWVFARRRHAGPLPLASAG